VGCDQCWLCRLICEVTSAGSQKPFKQVMTTLVVWSLMKMEHVTTRAVTV
jgi:hypothetical protein